MSGWQDYLFGLIVNKILVCVVYMMHFSEEMYHQIAVLGQTWEYSLWYNISEKNELLGLSRKWEGFLSTSSVQGTKLRKIIWFPFGNPPLKFGFPKLFQAFRREAKNLSESLALIFTGCPVGNPCKKIGFPAVFLGVPDTRKLSNFAPWRIWTFQVNLYLGES